MKSLGSIRNRTVVHNLRHIDCCYSTGEVGTFLSTETYHNDFVKKSVVLFQGNVHCRRSLEGLCLVAQIRNCNCCSRGYFKRKLTVQVSNYTTIGTFLHNVGANDRLSLGVFYCTRMVRVALYNLRSGGGISLESRTA